MDTGEISFLVDLKRQTKRAHIWLHKANDTACHMWSTNGLPKKSYEVCANRSGRDICKMCAHNFEEKGGVFPQDRKKLNDIEIAQKIWAYFGPGDKRGCPPEMITAIGLIINMRQPERLRTSDALNAFFCADCGTDQLPCHCNK